MVNKLQGYEDAVNYLCKRANLNNVANILDNKFNEMAKEA